MHKIDIYRKADIFTIITLEDNSTQRRTLMGEDQLEISFFLDFAAEFDINDYCDVFGVRYILHKLPAVTKHSAIRYEYAMTMRSEAANLERVQFMFLGLQNNWTVTDFSLMGTLEDFMKLAVDNANRIEEANNSGQTWIQGQTLVTKPRLLTFTDLHVLDAIRVIADAFDTEYFIEGKTIHLSRRLRPTSYVFRYGRGWGLNELVRRPVDNQQLVTRLHVFGSNLNLPAGYRGGVPRLQKGQLTYYDYNTQRYGIIEGVRTWDDIYPHREGTVTAVSLVDHYRFNDGTMDFDLNNYIIPGLTPKVSFLTGQLQGYTFEIKSYDSIAQEFTLLRNRTEKALDVPSSDIKQAIGDQYTLVDIALPQSYIDAAELELSTVAWEYLKTWAVPRVTYTVNFDPTYLRVREIVLNLGDSCRIVDEAIGLNRQIRITGVRRNLVNEFQMEVDFSDKTPQDIIRELRMGINGNKTQMSNIERSLETNGVLQRKIAGDVTIEQGSLVLPDLSANPGTGNIRTVQIDLDTGRLYHS